MSYDDAETGTATGHPVELFRFTVGATVYTYTSADEDQVYASETYTVEPLLRGALELDGESSEGKIELTVAPTNPLASYFVGYIPEPAMQVVLYRRHRTDPEVLASRWTVASGAFKEDGSFVMTCLPAGEAFRRPVPKNSFSKQCNWALYSAQCGVSANAHRVSAVVSAIAGETLQVSAASGYPDGYFSNGWLETETGARRWIVVHVGATLTLMSPLPGLAVNDGLNLFPGCNRTEADCAGKFSNLDNHLGFARVPTRNPFKGSVT